MSLCVVPLGGVCNVNGSCIWEKMIEGIKMSRKKIFFMNTPKKINDELMKVTVHIFILSEIKPSVQESKINDFVPHFND